MSINNQNTFLNIEDAHLRLRTGNVYAQGINIGGITVDTAHGLQRVSDTGNVTSNTLQFANATTAFVTTANVTVGRDITVTGNATVSSNLTVTGNALISDDLTVTENLLVSNNLTVTGNLNVATIMSDSNVVTEYTGPHDRPLRKYPEVALTADAETVSGYKGYKVTTSSLGGGDGTGYRVFDGNYADSSTVWGSGDFYNSSDGDATVSGAASTTVSGVSGAVIGEWIGLQLPNKIRLQDVKIAPQSYAGTLYGPVSYTHLTLPTN